MLNASQVPPSQSCQELRVNVRSEFGTTDIFVSRIYAKPTAEHSEWQQDTHKEGWVLVDLVFM